MVDNLTVTDLKIRRRRRLLIPIFASVIIVLLMLFVIPTKEDFLQSSLISAAGIEELSAGLGIFLSPSLITDLGTININPSIVPLLNNSNLFTNSQIIQGGLRITNLSDASCDVKTANGNFYCGTDATGAGAGFSNAISNLTAIVSPNTDLNISTTTPDNNRTISILLNNISCSQIRATGGDTDFCADATGASSSILQDVYNGTVSSLITVGIINITSNDVTQNNTFTLRLTNESGSYASITWAYNQSDNSQLKFNYNFTTSDLFNYNQSNYSSMELQGSYKTYWINQTFSIIGDFAKFWNNQTANYLLINSSTVAGLNNESGSYSAIRWGYNTTTPILSMTNTWLAPQTFTPTLGTSVWTFNSNITLNANLTMVREATITSNGNRIIPNNGSCIRLLGLTSQINVC